jgi:hypothetical protein
MANDGSGNTGVVAVLVIFVIVLALGFFAWQGGWFGGGDGPDLNVNIEADAPDVDRPQINLPAPEAPAPGNAPTEAPASE